MRSRPPRSSIPQSMRHPRRFPDTAAKSYVSCLRLVPAPDPSGPNARFRRRKPRLTTGIEDLPSTVRMTRSRHPLQGKSLPVFGGMRRHGAVELLPFAVHTFTNLGVVAGSQRTPADRISRRESPRDCRVRTQLRNIRHPIAVVVVKRWWPRIWTRNMVEPKRTSATWRDRLDG